MLILIHSIFEHGLDSILGNSFSFHMQLLQSWLQRGPLEHTKSSPTAVFHISLHIFRYSKFTWTPLCFTISISSQLKVQQFFILYVYLFFNKNEKLTHVKILWHEIFSNYGVLLVHPIALTINVKCSQFDLAAKQGKSLGVTVCCFTLLHPAGDNRSLSYHRANVFKVTMNNLSYLRIQ